MDHAAHEPGTDPDRPECLAFSYEPGWYRSLLTERASLRQPVVIPEAAGIEVVIPEAALPEVVVPDLEGHQTGGRGPLNVR